MQKKTLIIKLWLLLFVTASLVFAQNREGFKEGNLTDGPYVFYKGDKIIVKNCVPDGDKIKVTETVLTKDEKDNITLNCKKAGYKPAEFSFKLKSKLETPKSEYEASDKIFAISDIEGNFASFTQMLKHAGVIDEKLNWSFGNGHLVVIGDIFDRGIHVTECLWLLYSLEEQAKKSGGFVHTMFGNHDMMNLRGDLRYIEDKYNVVPEAMGITYRELFGVDTELGRWLRTKNSIVKIGEKIFVHGGLSPKLAETGLNIDEINDKMRDLMYISHRRESDKTLKLLAGSFGPMWYRGYFMASKKRYKKATDEEVNKVLAHFKGKQVYVGHTIFDKPEAHYNRKIIAVDVKHTADHVIADPENISWGVLIEKDKLTRIDLFNNREKF